MANTIDWGQGAVNNTIDWGKGKTNATNNWGAIYDDTPAGETNITGSGASASLILDDYPNAAVAYSLRKLRTAYTGSAIRVRRSNDNAEQDIAFNGNDLDTASLLSFVGANNGFVTTWYDQSTNANNSTQATAANQSQVVLNGNLILDADTSKITTTWTTDFYNLTSGIDTNTKYLSVSMFRRGAGTNDVLVHLGNTAANNPVTLFWLGTTNSYGVLSRMPTTVIFDNVSTVGRCVMTSLRDSSNLKVGYRNGVQLTTTATVTPISQTLNAFGRYTTSKTTGQYQEYIYWDSEQSANRTGIEDNIKTYWNAY